MVGQTISHYKILEKLGVGGMGVVYKAQDLKLDRFVALKFLPPDLSVNEEEKQRFIHEAKAASALDHPNICNIHEIDETKDGQIFICMAHYEGETLQNKVSSNQLSVDSAIDIAIQIAQGLAAVHAHGIVHRDIKPANIIVTNDGAAKIVDFGIAKLAGATRIPTTGTTIGTPAYISPEQARGEPVDHRTDIWSLGVVLYEMLTGQPPFKEEVEQALLYSILHEKPEPLSKYRAGVPERLQRIVDKALDKNPETRYQHIEDLLADLQRERKRGSAKLAFTTLALITAVIMMVALYVFNRQPAKPILATHKQVTFVGNASFPAISPDGQFITYVAGKDSEQSVMVQNFTGGQPLEIFSGIKFLSFLRWSPDGSEFIFSTIMMSDSSWQTFIVPRTGGSSRRITGGPYLCWSHDGSQIAHARENWKRVGITNKTTDEVTSISLRGSFDWLWDIDWSPLGNRLLFLTVNQRQYRIWTIKVDGSQQQQVAEDSVRLFSPRWSADGETIYYLRSNGQTKDLMKIKIASETGKTKVSAYVLQTGLQAGEFFTLSQDNKRLLYTRELVYSNLWLVNPEDRAPIVKTKQLTTGTSSITQPRISPDGERLAFSIEKESHANIFVMPIAGSQMQQLTFLNSYNAGVAWSPDGKKIVFGSTQGGTPKVWRVDSNGGAPRSFDKSELSISFNLTWSPDSHILYQRPGNRNFHILNPQTEQERPLVPNDSVGWIFSPCYSPDGKSVAVFWERKGTKFDGVWLVSLEDSLQVLISKGDLAPIEWSTDGKWIYAWNILKKPVEILMVPVNGGKPKTLVTLPFDHIESQIGNGNGISMTPDGKRIVCVVVETQSDVWMMENFDPEVERK